MSKSESTAERMAAIYLKEVKGTFRNDEFDTRSFMNSMRNRIPLQQTPSPALTAKAPTLNPSSNPSLKNQGIFRLCTKRLRKKEQNAEQSTRAPSKSLFLFLRPPSLVDPSREPLRRSCKGFHGGSLIETLMGTSKGSLLETPIGILKGSLIEALNPKPLALSPT